MAIPALVIIGSLVGRQIGIYPRAYDSWLVVGIFWGMLIGRPSLLKSLAINNARKPLDKLVTQAREAMKEILNSTNKIKSGLKHKSVDDVLAIYILRKHRHDFSDPISP